MTNHQALHKESFFKDTQGHVVLWQLPNIPLYGWIIFKLLSMLPLAAHVQAGAERISSAFLFTWAFLEITKGVNYFRRLLGVVVMIALILSILK